MGFFFEGHGNEDMNMKYLTLFLSSSLNALRDDKLSIIAARLYKFGIWSVFEYACG